MKPLVVIVGAFFVAALIALKITSCNSCNNEKAVQAKQEPEPTESTRALPPRRVEAKPASVGPSQPVTQNEESNKLDLILYMNWDDKVYKLRRVVTTNYSVRPTGTVSMVQTGVVPVGPAPPARVPTAEEAQAAREAWREELRDKREYK